MRSGLRPILPFRPLPWHPETPLGNLPPSPLSGDQCKIILRIVRGADMTLDEARGAIIATLQKVQSTSGLACPTLTGGEVPSKVLEQFDSTVWPVATTWIARQLGVVIANDVHIFGGKDGGPLLTINQTAEVICKKHKKIADSYGVAAE